MSRNPFLDLGFPAEEAAALEHYIDRKGWSQAEAARSLKIPQPTVSKIVNGNVDKLSIEFLVKLMVRAGLPVGISGGRAKSTRPSGRHHPASAVRGPAPGTNSSPNSRGLRP